MGNASANPSWPLQPPELRPIEEEIERYGLEEHIVELDEQGLCVVPLAKLQLAKGSVGQTIQALLEMAERRTGVHFDLDKGPAQKLSPNIEQIGQFMMPHLLLEGPLFEDIFVNPVRKTIMRYMLGDVHHMYGSNCWVKFRTPDTHSWRLTTPIHSDTTAPLPWRPEAPYVANMNWILTPYSQENGALAFVPESHKRGCHPLYFDTLEKAVPVVAPAGSMIFFHGATWHGGFRRETPGLRLSVHGLCCRQHYSADYNYSGWLPTEAFTRSADPDYLRMVTREDDPSARSNSEPPGARQPFVAQAT